MIRLKPLLEQDTPRFDFYAYLNSTIAPQTAAELGETIERYLGKGANGSAYLLSSGRVLKFTTDATEVAAATRIHRLASLPHICGYYNIHPIRNAQIAAWLYATYQRELYALMMDGVHVLSNDQQAWWSFMSPTFFDSRYTDAALQTHYAGIDLRTYDKPGWEPFVRTMLSQRASIRRSFRQRRINPAEAHSGNVGFDSHGQFTHFDPWMFQHKQPGRSHEETAVGLMRPIEIR